MSKFKVGDTVIYKGESLETPIMDLVKGKEYKVLGIIHGNLQLCEKQVKEGYGWWDSPFSVVKEPTFNVGDKVKYIGGEPDSCLKPDSVHTVAAVDDIGWLKIENSAYLFDPDKFELVSIDWTKPIQTRDGRTVKLLTTECLGRFPVLANIEGEDATEKFTITGKYLAEFYHDNWDLENVPEKPKQESFYVNFYQGECRGTWISDCHPTRYIANKEDSILPDRRIACKKITIIAGEFDD